MRYIFWSGYQLLMSCVWVQCSCLNRQREYIVVVSRSIFSKTNICHVGLASYSRRATWLILAYISGIRSTVINKVKYHLKRHVYWSYLPQTTSSVVEINDAVMWKIWTMWKERIVISSCSKMANFPENPMKGSFINSMTQRTITTPA